MVSFYLFTYDNCVTGCYMDIETKLDLIHSLPTEEVVTKEDMRTLLETKSHPVHYIGLEISGMPHIGHILVAGKKINDLDKAGIKTQVLLADWHTVANNKLGGDWERIIKASEFYRRLFNLVCPNTRVVLGSELYKNNDEYWKTLIKMSRKVTMARATRTMIIQGRSEKDVLHVSQYIYPIMQINDIRELGVDIPHSGIDQRRVHMLAKELFKEFDFNGIVPLHHHLLASLAEPPKVHESSDKEEIVAAMKMSKSKAGSAISILASDSEVMHTLKNAWCPLGIVDENPVLELCKYVIFPTLGHLTVERDAKYGGDEEFHSYAELQGAFSEKKLHPVDLKTSVGRSISSILEPIRKEFQKEREEIIKLLSLQ